MSILSALTPWEADVENATAQIPGRSPEDAAPRAARPPAQRPVAADTRIDDGLVLVRAELEAMIRAHRSDAFVQGEVCAQLWDDLGDGLGGKLIRPRLVLAAHLGLGGTDPTVAATVAAAVEVLHAAMLVHDDLLDRDEVRRGRPNVAGATRQRLSGLGLDPVTVDDQVTAAAVLAGDAGIAATFGLLATAPAPAPVLVRLVELFATSIRTTVAGELLDVRAELSAPHEVPALTVAELKTAAYSGQLPLVAGGIVAGAGPAQLAALAQVGLRLGIAYQLADDELGVFGDPTRTGKSVVSDLRDGKRTALLRATWERADDSARQVLRTHVGDRDLDELGAARVRAVMRSSGAVEHVRTVARTYLSSAVELARAELPAAFAGQLDLLVDDLAARGY